MASTTTDRRFGVNVGQAIKVAVSCMSTGSNLDLDGLDTVDGVTLTKDQRVLVQHQTDATANGIYLARSGTWVRAPDFDGNYDVAGGSMIVVQGGDTYAGSLWRVANAAGSVTIDTDNITFAIIRGSTYGGFGDNVSVASGDSLTNPRLTMASSATLVKDSLWTSSTAGTLAPVSTHQVVRDNNIQGYFETVQTVTSTTAGALQFALRDGNVIYHLLTQDTTFQVPSDWPTSSGNAASLTMHISQNGTAGHAFSYSTAAAQTFDFGDGTTHGMSTGSNAVDTITGYGLGSTAPTLYMVTAITGGSSYT